MDDKTLRKILKEELQNFATKDDLRSVVTKNDLKVELKKLQNNLEEYIADVVVSVDKHKAEKTDVQVLEKRVKHLETELLPSM